MIIDIELKNIESNETGYEKIISLWLQLRDCIFDEINLTLSDWFSANMSAVLGSILDELLTLNTINIISNNAKIISILKRNDFLSFFGYPLESDFNRTTIKYKKIEPQDSSYFIKYVWEELLSQSNMPILSNLLKKKIQESIYEMFVNAQIHSGTKYIYTCGQFYPHNHYIEFTIADRGVGFKKNVSKKTGINSGIEAIKWAIKDGNTTKTDAPGGLGLSILKDFITLNKGKIQIISYDGFYEFDSGNEIEQTLSSPFLGTIINLKFKTDDVCSYKLSSETNLQ